MNYINRVNYSRGYAKRDFSKPTPIKEDFDVDITELSHRGRGRHSNSMHSYKDIKTIKYLARIAVKYKIDSNEFLNCIVEAWNNEESKYEQLNISCRKKNKDSATFLFTKGKKLMAQFPISNKILQGKNRLKSYMKSFYDKFTSVKNLKVINAKIKYLKVGMKKINLKAKILEISKPKKVHTVYGTTGFISNALITDKTGKMKMSLWNHQIKMVSEGDAIKIENGKVARFRGEPQLRIGRSGSLSVIE